MSNERDTNQDVLRAAEVVAFARSLLRGSGPGSRDEATARKLLTDCGLTVVDKLLPEHRDRPWWTRSGWTISWNADRGMWHDERHPEADRAAWISQERVEAQAFRDGPYAEFW